MDLPGLNRGSAVSLNLKQIAYPVGQCIFGLAYAKWTNIVKWDRPHTKLPDFLGVFLHHHGLLLKSVLSNMFSNKTTIPQKKTKKKMLWLRNSLPKLGGCGVGSSPPEPYRWDHTQYLQQSRITVSAINLVETIEIWMGSLTNCNDQE